MTKVYTTIRSWPAIAVATAFLGGTAYVLFQDVASLADINAGHVLTMLAILGSTAGGHQIVPTLREGRIFLAPVVLALTIVSFFYILIISGARTAEMSAAKAQHQVDVAAERVRVVRLRAEAEEMQRAHRAKLAAECGSGKGKRCEGITETLKVYDAAIKGHDADLARLGSAPAPNAGLAAASQMIALLPGVTAKPVEIERQLVILFPWFAVLITEIGAIAFLSRGLGHRRQLTGNSLQLPPPDQKPMPLVAQLSNRRQLPATVAGNRRQPLPRNRAEAEADLVRLLAQKKQLPSQDWLAERWGVHKATVSKWLGAWERDGLVERSSEGRCKTVVAA